MSELESAAAIPQETGAITENAQEFNETPAETDTPSDTQAFLTVKFNHEDKSLGENEAKEYAQKGLNYDKVKSAYETLENQNKALYDAAKAEGFDNLENYVLALKAHKLAPVPSLETAMQPFLKDGLSETTARQLAQMTINEIAARNTSVIEKSKSAIASSYDSKLQKQANLLMEIFPQYKGISKMPDDFVSKYEDKIINEDLSYLEAVFDYEYNRLKAENEAFKAQLHANCANEENQKTSTGSIKDDGEDRTYFTREQVENMSPEEIRKHYTHITKSMKKW